jgi:hypothetical protein
VSLAARLGRVANELARKADALEHQGERTMREATKRLEVVAGGGDVLAALARRPRERCRWGATVEAGALRLTAAARLRVSLLHVREARAFLARADRLDDR